MSTQRQLDTEAAIRQQKSFLLAFRHLLETYERSRKEILEGIKKFEADLIFLDNCKEGAPANIRRHEEILRKLQIKNVAVGALRSRSQREKPTVRNNFDRKLKQLLELANDPDIGPMVRQMLEQAKAASETS